MIKFENVVKDIRLFWTVSDIECFHYSLHYTITRNPWDGFRWNFQRMIITMQPICTQRLTEFEVVVWDIFDFFELIWTSNYFINAWNFLITRKPWGKFCSNFQRIIITTFPIDSQRLTSNFSFFNLSSFELGFFLQFCFLFEWGFLPLHRVCCTPAHFYVYRHTNTCVSRHSNPLTLERTHIRTHSYLHSNTLALEHAGTRTRLLSNSLALEHTRTRAHATYSHSHIQSHALTFTYTHILARWWFASTLMHAHSTFVHTQDWTHSLTIPHAFTHTHTHAYAEGKYFPCYVHYACETLRELFWLTNLFLVQ